jgi:hypothetical protein
LSTFSSSYREARNKFLDAARVAGATLTQHQHPRARGVDEEALYLDVARLGSADAGRVLFVGSGTHGIEGYPGSGVQTGWLLANGKSSLPADTALVFTHAHNPWGFSNKTRVTEENVDLNRNFVDHAEPHPQNPGYAGLHAKFRPRNWSDAAVADALAALEAFRAEHGEQAFSDAVDGGQYSHPDGAYYGGARAQWSNTTLRGVYRKESANAKHAVIVDLHTGIGEYGDAVFICFHEEASAARSRCAAWWGARAVNMAGIKIPKLARYSGTILGAFQQEVSHAERTEIAVEFGTRPRDEMKAAGFADLWLRHHGQDDPALAAQLKQRYVEAFYPSDPAWRARVLAQGTEIIDQGLAGLGAD